MKGDGRCSHASIAPEEPIARGPLLAQVRWKAETEEAVPTFCVESRRAALLERPRLRCHRVPDRASPDAKAVNKIALCSPYFMLCV